jgi:hypothetical protein
MRKDPLQPLHCEVAETEALCRRALEVDYAHLIDALPELPHTPESWNRLLSGIPDDRSRMERLRQLTCNAERLLACPPGSVERYGVLNACLAALPRLATLPVHDSVNRQFCATFRKIASRAQGWRGRLNHDSDAFAELALIVTLRRFHAGQESFDIFSMPRTWLLRVHPLALPGVVRQLAFEMGGLAPIAMPHLNYWRDNPLLMLRKEHDLSFWRIARSIERQPRIKGVVAASWLYSVEVGEVTPHLAWVRDFFLNAGAYLVDMDPAPVRSGFMIGSELRRRLYEEGKFHPRQTLVLWPRRKILAWADAISQTGDRSQFRGTAEKRFMPYWRSNANKILSSGQFTILNCECLATFAPRRYFRNVFILPCLLVGVAVAMALGLWAVLPALMAAVVGIWLVQYFFLQ